VHVSAVLKDSATYEHVRPETGGHQLSSAMLVKRSVGPRQYLYKLKQIGLTDRLNEDARASCSIASSRWSTTATSWRLPKARFELLAREALHPELRFFEVESYDVATRAFGAGDSRTTAAVTLLAGDEVLSETRHGAWAL